MGLCGECYGWLVGVSPLWGFVVCAMALLVGGRPYRAMWCVLWLVSGCFALLGLVGECFGFVSGCVAAMGIFGVCYGWLVGVSPRWG